MPRDKEQSRQCVVSRKTLPIGDLLRFALSPEGQIVPDVDAKAPGRGVWVSLSQAMVEEAVAKKAFARSLKQPVEVSQDLAQLARTRLEQRLLGALGLCRKAGQLVTGATKVRAAIEKPGIIALFTSVDARPDGRQKMAGAYTASAAGDPIEHFELLTSEQMGLALGLENVIHAALVEGAAARSALFRARQLARYLKD